MTDAIIIAACIIVLLIAITHLWQYDTPNAVAARRGKRHGRGGGRG